MISSLSSGATWQRTLSFFAKSIQVISSLSSGATLQRTSSSLQKVFRWLAALAFKYSLFFGCHLAEDFFFAKSIQVISSIVVKIFFVFWCYLAEDFFFAKSIQVISSTGCKYSSSLGATWLRTSLLKVLVFKKVFFVSWWYGTWQRASSLPTVGDLAALAFKYSLSFCVTSRKLLLC